MTSTAIICGILLVLIGIIGYVHGALTGHGSFTALIPLVFGVVIALLGYSGQVKENLRKHLMHAALLVAAIGFLGTAGRLISKFSTLSFSAAVVAQVSMAIVCLLFIVLGIRSFIEARKNRG